MFFKTQEGKETILKLYQQKLEQLQIAYTEQQLETRFGKTNILVSGETQNPPLLLIHGTGGCAPLMLESLPNLTKAYRVYAIDVLAQPNKSAETRLDMASLDYGKWLTEIIIKLRLQDVTLVGFSFGGLISLKALEFNQTPIKHVFLIAPVCIVNGNPLLGLLKMFIPLKKFIKTNNPKFIKRVMDALFSEYDDFALEFMSASFQHCNMDFSPLPILSKKTAQQIQTPITIFAAEKDLMFPGKKMIKRAKHLFPSLAQTLLLKGSKHVPNAADFKRIEAVVLKGRE